MSLVTVIIPLYNHAAFFKACLNSVIAQTYRDIELIVIDDHSTDDSYEVAHAALEQHKDRFVQTKLVRNARNRGAAFSLNRGIALAKGEFLAFLNSDDLFLPKRLEVLVEAIKREKRAWGFSAIAPTGADGQPFWTNYESHKFAMEPTQLHDAFPSPSWALLQFQTSISTGNIVVNKQLALNVGGFLPLSYCHDWAFVLACAWHSEYSFVNTPLYQYRFHGNNSFESLGHMASNDIAHVLRAHAVRAANAPPLNPNYPTPRFGSTVYAAVSGQLDLPSLMEEIYSPYKPFHRTIASDSIL
jgi:glycosyltransferase involved in cell wall biosynthesis